MAVTPKSTIQSKPLLKPLSVVMDFKENTYIDESFMSEARWDLADKISYVRNLLRGLCLTPFIVADAHSCLNYCKEIGDKSSVKYFEDIIAEGKDKVTCDSNNRQGTMQDLKEGKLLLPKGSHLLNTGAGIHTLNLSEDTKYEDLNDTDKTFLNAIPMLTITITAATRRNLAEVFDAVNKGVTQNAQELRQSWYSNFAQPIRNLARTFHSKFLDCGLVTQKEINRRAVDEFMVDCSHHMLKDNDMKYNKPTRDGYYVELSEGYSAVSKVKDILDDIWFPEKDDKSPYKITKRTIFVNFMLRKFLSNNNYKIVENRKFDEWLYSNDFEWQQNSPCKLELQNGISYDYKSAGRFHIEFIKWNFDIWIEALNNYIERTENVISVDSIRLASPYQKLLLWKRQGNICPQTSKKIPFDEILDSTKWQADHIVLYKDGGLTELDNLRLVDASFNLKRKTKTEDIEFDMSELPITQTNIG